MTQNLQQRVDALWAEMEAHYAPSLTPADFKTLHDLDAAALDGTLTEATLERTSRRLKSRPRSYSVDHSTGFVDPACKASTSHRKVLHGDKYIQHRGRGKWRVKLTVHGMAYDETFKTQREAQLYRDKMVEHRKTEASVRAIYKADNDARVKQEVRTLTAAKEAAAQRKVALRDALSEPGVTSWSDVLRRPEFDQWSYNPAQRSAVRPKQGATEASEAI